MSINKWDIWLADVVFEDDLTEHKKRPVLVITPGQVYILTAKITSHKPRLNFDGEYDIKDLKSAGLDKQSTIRLSKTIKIKSRFFIRKLGVLSEKDKIEVEKILSELNESMKKDGKLILEETDEMPNKLIEEYTNKYVATFHDGHMVNRKERVIITADNIDDAVDKAYDLPQANHYKNVNVTYYQDGLGVYNVEYDLIDNNKHIDEYQPVIALSPSQAKTYFNKKYRGKYTDSSRNIKSVHDKKQSEYDCRINGAVYATYLYDVDEKIINKVKDNATISEEITESTQIRDELLKTPAESLATAETEGIKQQCLKVFTMSEYFKEEK
jgi:hypothetical protein